MRTNLTRLATAAALLFAAAAADAKPHRVVVAEFDGTPHQLAETGRATVLALLSSYDLVSTDSWRDALAQSPGHGKSQWQKASKTTSVDALVQGYITDEGKHHILTVSVLDASTGNEIDSVSVRVGEHGPSPEATQKLQSQLEELLNWIDQDPLAERVKSPYQPITDYVGTKKDAAPVHAKGRSLDDDDADDADSGDDDDWQPRRRPKHRHHKQHRADRPGLTDERDVQDDDEPVQTARPRQDVAVAVPSTPAPVTAPAIAPASKDVASTEQKNALDIIGPDQATLEAQTLDPKLQHKPEPSKRYMISAGGYLASRGINFEYDQNTDSPPPEYPASGIKGVQVQAEVYPWPIKKMDADMTGLGFTFGIQKSVGSYLTAMDDTGTGDYTLEHTAWQLGVHYRYPLGEMLTLDGEGNFGSIEHRIIDLPESIEIPDTKYNYMGAGVHLDLAVADKTYVGFGARYMYIFSVGDVADQDWYGAGEAYGYALDANFLIPLPSSLFVRGGLEYRTVHMDFEGSGAVTMAHAVWTATDNQIMGSANLGIKF